MLRVELTLIPTTFTYFVPRLRHLRCPGLYLVVVVAAESLSDPLETFAGDKFSDAMAVPSAITDSFELQLDELGIGDGGSNRSDNL